jgi:hypothetical protein
VADLRESQAVLESLDGGAPALAESQAVIEVLADAVPGLLAESQAVIEVLIENATVIGPGGGGGDPGSGTNPAAGNLPTTLPLLFATITLQSGSVYPYAETLLSDPSTWYGGRKDARILRVSDVRRTLSDPTGAPQLQTWQIELADTDRALRGLQASGALMGAKVELYIVDDAVRRAQGVPFRIAAGVVASHRGLSGFRYELTIEDKIGTLFADALQEKKVPRLLTTDDVPLLNPAFDGVAVPILYGLLSDDDQPNPQGIVPCTFIGGPFNLTAIGGVNADVDVYLICGHAVSNVLAVFYNMPDAPDVRHRVPEGEYGVNLLAPHRPGWIAATGQAGQYVDYNGYRYTVLFVRHSIPFPTQDPDGVPVTVDLAEAARNGNITITANVHGIAANADGTGLVIDDIDRIWQHFLTNFVYNTYTTGAWAAVPSFGAYSVIDTATVVAAKAAADARLPARYRAGYLIGRGGQQVSVWSVLSELCFSGDVDMGINRHGQLILSRDVPSAASVVTFNAQRDVLEDGLATDLDHAHYANTLKYRYAYRYVPDTAPRATPYKGWPVPERTVAPYAEWVSGTVTTSDTAAITAVQRTVTADANLYAIRDQDVADNIAGHKLARARGPSGTPDGTRIVTVTTGLQGYGRDGTVLDLGSVIAITHPEGLRSTGWTAQRARIVAITYHPQTFTVSLECRVSAALFADPPPARAGVTGRAPVVSIG